MVEPDNFEEDLFADLYTEDDVPPKPEVEATTNTPKPEISIQPEIKTQETTGNNTVDETEQVQKEEQVQEADGENESTHNEISSGAENSFESPATIEGHGPGIKEDG